MAKGKGFDVISEAHERAQHNINPHYWVNRVTHFTYASWMAEKKLSLMILPFLIITWIIVISNLTGGESNDNNFWKTLFDFSDAASTNRFVLFLFLVFYTIITLIASFQVVFSRFQKSMEQTERKEKRKKKHPKRRKDYGGS